MSMIGGVRSAQAPRRAPCASSAVLNCIGMCEQAAVSGRQECVLK
jgi:hypothetical protein